MKKLTLILSMMIALIGLNANAAIYLVGNEPLGQGWDPSKGIEMTENNDGTYTYDVVINGEAWFCFAEALTPGNSNEDWDVFNGQYRYGPTGGSNQTVDAGAWITTQKQGNGTGSYYFRGTGDKYTVTFDKTNMKFKIDGYVEPVVYESFTVAGNNADIFGETWNVTLTQNDMTLDETDGWYKLVKENVEITGAPYTLYYKVAANHAWGESWGNPDGPDGNQDYVFNENGTYNLTFKFNFDTKEVSLDAVQTQVGPAIDPFTGDLFIVGQVNNNGWDPSNGIPMLTEDEDTFTLANAQITDSGDGFGYFSFMAVLGSNSDSWPANGYRIGAAEDGTVAVLDQFVDMGGFGTVGAFKVEPGYYNITVVLSAGENGQLKLTAGQAPEPTVDDVYIMGDVNNYAWDPTQGVKMTYNEGIYTAQITTQNQENKEVGYFEFTKKLADVESETPWDDIASFRFGPVCEGDDWVMTEELLGVECDLALTGQSHSIAIPEGTWTVTVDLEHAKFTINGTWPTDTVVPQPETPDVYIFGDVNNYAWDPTQGVKMTYNEGIYTAQITTQNQENKEVGYFEFTKKLADPESETPWDDIAGFRFGPVCEGNDWVMTEELLGVECDLALTGQSHSIAIPEGTWTVTVDLEHAKFTINGTWPVDTVVPEPYTGDVYILGEVNDNGGWFPNVGVKMTRNAETNVYTATITTAGENVAEGEEIGYSYFSFTKKLAEQDWENGGWDEINNGSDRFGAVTDGAPFLVTDEMLGIDLSLAYAVDPCAFKIPAGEWNLTLSVDDMKLIIEKVTSIRGDVNKDGFVRIDDVTALIDYLLSGNGANIDLVAADCNKDSDIRIDDVTALIDFLLGGSWPED